MTKFKLEDPLEPEMILFGISCHERDYRLCWAMNLALGLEMERKEEDLEYLIGGNEQEKAYFSIFTHENEEDQVLFSLISNRSEKGALIPEQKQTDFFFRIETEEEGDWSWMLERLRNIDMVLMAFELDPDKIPSRSNLIS